MLTFCAVWSCFEYQTGPHLTQNVKKTSGNLIEETKKLKNYATGNKQRWNFIRQYFLYFKLMTVNLLQLRVTHSIKRNLDSKIDFYTHLKNTSEQFIFCA